MSYEVITLIGIGLIVILQLLLMAEIISIGEEIKKRIKRLSNSNSNNNNKYNSVIRRGR